MKDEIATISKEGETSIASPEATVGNGESLVASYLACVARTPIEKEIEELREETARLLIRLELSRRESYFQSQEPDSLSALSGNQEAEFDKRLYDFSIEHRIGFYPHNTWRMRVLEHAAKEHPDLSVTKRKRGRPKEPRYGFFFSALYDPGADPHYKHIEAERLRAAREGVRFSQVKCIREMLLRGEPDLAKRNNGENFRAAVTAIEKKLGAIRRKLDTSLRTARK